MEQARRTVRRWAADELAVALDLALCGLLACMAGAALVRSPWALALLVPAAFVMWLQAGASN